MARPSHPPTNYYNALWNALSGKFISQGCCIPRMKTILIGGRSFVSVFNTRYTRMKRSCVILFGLMKQYLSSMEHWIVISLMGSRKIHTYMGARQSIYRCPLYGVDCHTKKKLNSMVCVRELNIPRERPPLVSEVITNFLWIEGATWLAWRIPTTVFSIF
jgi:hypothetical protein